ncbi:hypothetical protein C1645_812091 [Glomus cerebriforme]|uniref:Ion transport domain-containing protein n=1 Tax=Glomus cerebriforme TaxID=658196 RepID=A0A397TNA8_9GLOM|nr:hypothetical protein C1645_812091 [Glomus cerebriforme]
MSSTNNNNNIGQCKYIAITMSPSGKEIATLNQKIVDAKPINSLKTWRIASDNTICLISEYTLRKDIGIKEKGKNWSLAISDADADGNTLIALSCFNFTNEDVPTFYESLIDTSSDDNINDVNTSASSSSILILIDDTTSSSDNIDDDMSINSSSPLMSESSESLNDMSPNGIENILNSIELNSTRVVSSSGKEFWPEIKSYSGFLQFFKKDILLISFHFGIIRVCKNDNYLNGLSQYVHQFLSKSVKSIKYHDRSESHNEKEKKSYEIIRYPDNFIENLEIMYEDDQLNTIKNCIVSGKLFIHNEKRNIEMYNLFSRNMDMLYHHSKFSTNPTTELTTKIRKTTNYIFAISKNAKLLAIKIDKNSVALYLNENSLNIASKKISNIQGELTYMAFFDDDENLLLLDEYENKNNLIIWNIFEDSEYLLHSSNEKIQIIGSSGKIIFIEGSNKPRLINFKVDNKEEIFKVIAEPNSSNYSKHVSITTDATEDGIFDTEPWLDSNHHQKNFWIYNDKEKKIARISYGFYTIQIWKIGKNDEFDELIYIYSDNYNREDNYYDLSKRILMKNSAPLDSSQVENRVKDLLTKDLSINVINVIDIYNSLIFFHKLKLSKIPHKKLLVDEFIEYTKNIIRNIINDKPDLWRLLDVKYNLVENLIYSRTNDIIKLILNIEKDQKLHIPQLYDRNGKRKLRYELIVALENNNTKIIQQLLNYYSHNAMENVGWMFTVTQAIPKISEKFPELIKKLFNNPVFYQKEIHLVKSRIRSSLPLKPSYTTFIVDTRLPLLTKTEYQNQLNQQNQLNNTDQQDQLDDNRTSRKLNDSLNNKIFMTPLPDFNEFTKGHKQIIHCPFFKLMSQKNLDLFHKKNPTLEAIIKFNWDIHFFQFMLRLSFYIIDFIIFNTRLLFISYFIKNGGTLAVLILNILHLVLHLIKSYFKIFDFITLNAFNVKLTRYQLFYALSSILQLITLILFVITYFSDLYAYNTFLSAFLDFVSITTLIVWIELFLFLRFNSDVGKYIIIITFLISTTIPYFLTLMTIIIGFSFSFFIIIVNAARLGIKPEETKYNIFENDTRLFSNITFEPVTSSPNFFKVLEIAYLWLYGNWDNIRNWDYIPIKLLALIASFFLIFIMTNVFMALMTDDINRAIRYSEIASYKYKVDFILESYLYPFIFLITENFHSRKIEETQDTFENVFYHSSTFHLLFGRYIFYIKESKSDWKTEIVKGTDELIENLANKHDKDIKDLVKKLESLKIV